MADPTYGRIDPDIQQMVEEWGPKNLGQRVAVENTMQARRNAQWAADRDGPFQLDTPPSQRLGLTERNPIVYCLWSWWSWSRTFRRGRKEHRRGRA